MVFYKSSPCYFGLLSFVIFGVLFVLTLLKNTSYITLVGTNKVMFVMVLMKFSGAIVYPMVSYFLLHL